VKPFRERNPVPIGAIGLLVILALLFVAFDAGKLPFIGGGTSMHADFGNASGLLAGDDVDIAGVKVGKVSSVSLDGNVVKVGMTVNSGMQIGNQTRADVKIKTLLGQMYVALTPAGPGTQKAVIPRSRTSTPLDVVQAFTQFGTEAGQINTAELAKAFGTLSTTFKNTPPEVHSSLVGLQRLSTTIASRNDALQSLLHDANNVTTTLASRDVQIARLINDSNLILRTLDQQRTVIHQLLIDTSSVANQLAGLVKDNRAVIGPALKNLKGTLDILNKNQTNLQETLHLAAPFVRDFTDVVGNGRWFETVLYNLGPSLAATGCVDLGGSKICPPLGGSSGSATP
jgi:phospholipid/cholesterol/gamma-HCH transport system substrate-binding protein